MILWLEAGKRGKGGKGRLMFSVEGEHFKKRRNQLGVPCEKNKSGKREKATGTDNRR